MDVMIKGRPRVKVANIDAARLRAIVKSLDGLVWVSSSRAAELVRSCQSAPSVTRQVLVLWAQRYGVQGESWAYGNRMYFAVAPVELNLDWLERFLVKTGRAHG